MVPAELGVHAERHVAADICERRQIAMHDAVDVEPDDHLVRMPVHRCQDVPGLGHGVGLPHLAGLLGQHEIMRLAEVIQARHQRGSQRR